MEYIKNYVTTVGSYLNEQQREDIENELMQSLEEQLEDMAESKDLTDSDVFEMLEKMGHPAKVAAAYAKQQYLIGPELYLSYKATWRTVIKIVVVVQVVLAGISILGGAGVLQAAIGVIAGSLWSGLIATGVVTAVFALLEHLGEKVDLYKKWQANALKNIKSQLKIEHSDAVINLISSVFLLCWMNNAFDIGAWFSNIGVAVSIGDGWSTFYWPVTLVLIGSAVISAYELFETYWTKPLLWLEMLISSVSVVILALLITQPDLSINIDAAQLPDSFEKVKWSVEKTITIALGVILAFEAYNLYQSGQRLKLINHKK